MEGRGCASVREMNGFLIGLGVFSSIFWMCVGWQALRAHQRLAASFEELVRRGRPAG